MTSGLRLFAATPRGPAILAPPPGVNELNDAFDALPLGIYEGLRTVDGERLVDLPAHLDRAARSVERLGWSVELDRAMLCSCLATILEGARTDSRVRFDVLSEAIDTPLGPARTLIGISPLVLPTPSAYRDGVGVRLLRELARREPLIKDAAFVLERRDYPLDGGEAFERLLVDSDERVLECTASNFFGIHSGVITTAGTDVLEGVTARRVMQLAREAEYSCDETGLTTAQLDDADEAFLTSSIKGVVPVVRVDERPVGTGTPGPITRELLERYETWMNAAAQTAREVAAQS